MTSRDKASIEMRAYSCCAAKLQVNHLMEHQPFEDRYGLKRAVSVQKVCELKGLAFFSGSTSGKR